RPAASPSVRGGTRAVETRPQEDGPGRRTRRGEGTIAPGRPARKSHGRTHTEGRAAREGARGRHGTRRAPASARHDRTRVGRTHELGGDMGWITTTDRLSIPEIHPIPRRGWGIR